MDYSTHESTEHELLNAARNNDLAAFGRLVQLHEGRIRGWLAVRLPSVHDAEDLAQETFLVAYRRLGEFDKSRSFSAWLQGIAQNLMMNYRRKRRPEAVGHAVELNQLVCDELERLHAKGREEEMLAAARHCVAELAPQDAAILQARYEANLSMVELCHRFGKKHSAITMWLHRIRLALRGCIEHRLSRA